MQSNAMRSLPASCARKQHYDVKEVFEQMQDHA
jgi:hypothetical protein